MVVVTLLNRVAAAHVLARHDDAALAGDGFPDGDAQLAAKPAPREGGEVARRRTARLREVVVGPSVKVEDLGAAVDDHARRVAVQ